MISRDSFINNGPFFSLSLSLLCLFAFLIYAICSRPALASNDNIPSLIQALEESGATSHADRFRKGKLLYQLQAWTEASAALSLMEKDLQEPLLSEALYLRGNSLYRTGDYSKAAASLNRIPSKSRFFYYGLYTRALISLETQNEKEAIEFLDQISKNFPAPAGTSNQDKPLLEGLALKSHLTLGFIFLENGNPSEAVRRFIIIPENSQFYPQALFGLGWSYAHMGRWVRSVIFWEDLASRYPESPYSREIMHLIGYAYSTLSAYGKALEHNGIAIKYYRDSINRISGIENDIKAKDFNALVKGAEIIGDRKLSDEVSLYKSLLDLEHSLMSENIGKDSVKIDPLINISSRIRDDIFKRLSERVIIGLEGIKHELSDISLITSLEISRNLRAEGGGQISRDLIFDKPR